MPCFGYYLGIQNGFKKMQKTVGFKLILNVVSSCNAIK